MLDMYANQKIKWLQKTGINDYNEPIFAKEKYINARISYNRSVITDIQGKSIVSNATLYTNTPIEVGDTITYDNKNWEIKEVHSVAGLNGNVEYYKGLL